MRVLRTLYAIVTARWFVTLVGAVLLAALVWWFGPLLAIGDARPLSSELSRLVTILVISILWGASNLWAQHRARRQNAQLVEQIAAPPPEADPAGEEVAELRARFEEALGKLRRRRFETRGGRSFLYQLPWYVLIGPPGSGKTTALLQSGLRFPLGEDERELRGIGGTRNCDWFFTDEAVLIDTAGRYTTQDSYQQADQGAWQGFLDLLRKHRPRQPINGVMVALSLVDVMQGDAQQLEAHARAIRARLGELEERLGVRVPIYLLLTKADLVAGFQETFADLDESAREQVFGFTFPHDPERPQAPSVAAFEQELDLLLARLDERRLERLEAERDLGRRAAIFGFPAQLAALEAPLARFLDRLVHASGYQSPVQLRGVYLSSGTQEGTPIDRLVQAMASTFGIRAEAPAATRGNRSFFLTRLLRDVVFAEASLVASNPRREWLQMWQRRAAYAAAILLLIGAGAAWAYSYAGNQARLRDLAGDLGAYQQEVAGLGPALHVEEAELEPVLPPLARLRAVRERVAATGDPWHLRFGLSQRSTLAASTGRAYQRGLERLLLPRLIAGLEQQLWAHIHAPEIVLDGLKVYLMLGGQGPLDPQLVTAWLDLTDWDGRFPEAERRQLHAHLESLLAALPELRKPGLDTELIARARETIRTLPLPQLAYQALLADPAVQALPEWRPLDHAGPAASQVLVRHSGQPLNAGIPGEFTYDGFHHAILPLLPDAAADVAVEGWLLGVGDEAAVSEQELARLQGDMLRLYYDDFIERWDRLLRDVTLRPLGDLRQSVEALRALSGSSSPLRLMLEAVVRETRLTEVPEEPEAEEGGVAVPGAVARAGQRLLGRAGGQARRLARLAGPLGGRAGEDAAEAEPPGQPVEDHFRYLAELIEGVGGAPPALDDALAALGSLYGELQQISVSPNPDQALVQRGGLQAVAAPVAQQAGRLPEPLDGWLEGVAARTAALSESAIRRQVNAAWQADVLPFCRQAIGGRFPFERGSAIDVSLADFGRLFAPGGDIDQFTNQHLAPLIDTASRPWRWNVQAGMPDSALRPFEVARRIRDGLFAGGATPQASFTLKPTDLDAGAARVQLDLDGQVATYQHGPVQPTAMQWPGPNGTNVVRLSFFPVGGGAPRVVTREGAWSWFRLLHEAEFRPTDLPELFHITFQTAGHRAGFELRAGSVVNPFNLGLLEQFRCPGQL
jgi:type VI secretion system protein ImpL